MFRKNDPYRPNVTAWAVTILLAVSSSVYIVVR
jgi:hypothetical protein